MQKYLDQLIGDMRDATRIIRPPHKLWEETGADPFDEVELEDMSYIEQFVEGEVMPIATITGIPPDVFPPSDKLTSEQQTLLAGEMEKLLDYFHFTLEFPENYPILLRYPFLCNFWHEEHVPMSFGTTHIELCNYDADTCPFPGYCTTCEEELESQSGKDYSCIDTDPFSLLPTSEELDKWWIHQQELERKNNQDNGEDNEDDERNDLDNEDDSSPF